MQATDSAGSRGSSGGGVARLAWTLLALVLASWLIYALRGVLTPVLFSFFLAYLLDPVVDRMELLSVPRATAIVVLLGGALLVLTVLVLLVLPAVINDLVVLASELPAALQRGLTLAGPWLAQRGIEVPATGHETLRAIEAQLKGLSPSALSSMRSVGSILVGGTASALSSAAALVLVPFLAFYSLLDFDRIMASIAGLIPERKRAAMLSVVREVDLVLGQFVRGQLLVMAIVGALYAGGYALLGVHLAVPIGIVAGLLAFIPYLGSAAALGLGVLMTLLHYESLGQLVAVIVVYTVIQVLEGFVITPRIVGDKLGLSALVVLVALMVGGELFGLIGVMLALPVAAVIKVFAERGLTRYRASPLFVGASAVVAADESPLPAQSRLRLRSPLARARLSARRRAEIRSPRASQTSA